jgi:3'-phosphoadenosine 5'-phosphosulfate sulfotransferase (PAPS reductase)/FAD synthetase
MNAEIRNHRTVHVFRPIIDWSLRDVWEKIRRFRIQPCPTYEIFNRCSCAICVFNSPSHWASVKLIYPDLFHQVVDAEKELGFTLDNKVDLNTFVGDAKSSIDDVEPKALEQIRTGVFNPEDVFVPAGQAWKFPRAAFRGSEGGPC